MKHWKGFCLFIREPERWFWPNQYYNPANCEAHYKTAEEIFEQTEGRVSHFLAATGAAGTVLEIIDGGWFPFKTST
jgi:cysteine synthase B